MDFISGDLQFVLLQEYFLNIGFTFLLEYILLGEIVFSWLIFILLVLFDGEPYDSLVNIFLFEEVLKL